MTDTPVPLTAEEEATLRIDASDPEAHTYSFTLNEVRRLLATLDAERAGVSLTGSGLREAALNLLAHNDFPKWHPDGDGCWSAFEAATMAARQDRAALSGESGEPKETER